jgi:uncharacterized protein (TIGR04255 family)
MARDERCPKLERQPLTLVLAEFRFKPVEFEPQAIAALKERFAPLFSELTEGVTQQVQLGDRGVTVVSAPYIVWRAPLLGKSVHLEADRIIYATTTYPRFDGFLRDSMAVVEALLETLRPSSLHRVGLRYNDVVVPMQDEALADYVYAPTLERDGGADSGRYAGGARSGRDARFGHDARSPRAVWFATGDQGTHR